MIEGCSLRVDHSRLIADLHSTHSGIIYVGETSAWHRMTQMTVHEGSIDWGFKASEGMARLYHTGCSMLAPAFIAIIGWLLVALDSIGKLTAYWQGYLQRLQPRASETNVLVPHQVSCPFAHLSPSGSFEGLRHRHRCPAY